MTRLKDLNIRWIDTLIVSRREMVQNVELGLIFVLVARSVEQLSDSVHD